MAEEIPYRRSAWLYDLMYADRDYAGAASEVHSIAGDLVPEAKDLLDVGCGTGRHLETLGSWYGCQGLDLNPGLLQRAEQRCPDMAFHVGDMRSFDLDASFDVVLCLFSAIGHLRGVGEMRDAIGRMAAHLRSPGVLLVEPWFTPESFWDGHMAVNFSDGPEANLAWMYRQRREDRRSILPIHYLAAAAGEPQYFTERQELFLFTQEEMCGAFEDAGLDVEYRETATWGRGLYLGRRATPRG